MSIVQAGDRLLLGATQGLHQSFDEGVTWSRVEGFPRSARIDRIVVNPRVAGHWYAQVWQTVVAPLGDGVPASRAEQQRLETRDGGATWQRAAFDSPTVRDLPAIHPDVNRALVWYASYVWRHSADGGSTWSSYSMDPASIRAAIGLPLPGSPFGAITQVDGGTLSVRISTNDGSGWSAPIATLPAASFPEPTLHPRRIVSARPFWLSRSFMSDSYAGTVDFSTGAVSSFPAISGEMLGVFDDPANADTAIGLHLPTYGSPNAGSCDSCARYVLASFTTGAAQWQMRGSVDVGTKHFESDRPALLPGDGARSWTADASVGVRRSDDGGNTWAVSNAGLREALVNAVAIDPRNPQILLAGRDMQTLQRSTDGGASWSDVGGQTPRDVRALQRSIVNPDHIVATAAGGLYRSLDAGASWQQVPTTLRAPGWRDIVWCAANETHLMAIVGRSLYRSIDAGVTWTFVRERPTTESFRFQLTSARLASGRTFFNDGHLQRTDDCGVTTTEIPDVDAVVVDPNDHDHFVAARSVPGGDSYLGVSIDGGATWTVTQNALIDRSYTTGSKSWIDACSRERYTTGRLATMQGTATGLVREPPALEHWRSDVRAYDSQCNAMQSYNVVATSAGGLWVSAAIRDQIFDDGFEPAD